MTIQFVNAREFAEILEKREGSPGPVSPRQVVNWCNDKKIRGTQRLGGVNGPHIIPAHAEDPRIQAMSKGILNPGERKEAL